MDNIMFSKKHIWVKKVGEEAIIGLTEYAQSKLGSIMFVNLPEPGDELVIGTKFGDAESIKTVSDLISPVSGNVVEINEEVVDDPSLINEDTYSSWLVKVANVIYDDLLTEEEYNMLEEIR